MSLFGNGRLDAAAAAALLLVMLPSVSYAYTPEEPQACQPDAFRLCGPEIPDVDRVTACMIAKRAQLSPQCRVFFRSGPEPVSEAGAPLNIRPSARKHVAPKSHKRKKPADT